ncbi:hypothetical protein [Microbacterium foliorum]|uniref:hypothetical protein n=1 Tax=Microbacterium foliorum TaxID=104336 RepID=UPI0028D36790|nr:hypothetical protein [Microbacterium foliorum]
MLDLGAIGGWVVAVLSVLITAIVSLFPKKGSIENTRIDQLQEDLASERQERKDLATEVRAIRAEQDRLARRDLAWILHYDLVKQGVEAGTIPPWPSLPEILGGPHEPS